MPCCRSTRSRASCAPRRPSDVVTLTLRPEDVRHLGEVVRARSGLVLTEDQAYLVESRLTPLARRLGFPPLAALMAAVRQPASEALLDAVTEAMTTNETSFFRDGHPFELLRRMALPYLLMTRAAVRRLRIWSAAAATGQEAYSILFCLQEFARTLEGWQVEVVGTDISAAALERARRPLHPLRGPARPARAAPGPSLRAGRRGLARQGGDAAAGHLREA